MWKVREVYDDTEFFKIAYRWYVGPGGFVKALRDFNGGYTEGEFVEAVCSGRAFRGDEDGQPKVLVYAERLGPDRYEGHLICSPEADGRLISAVIGYSINEGLKDGATVICQVSRHHKARADMLKLSGFKDSGLRVWQGIYRGQPQEMLYYVAGRS